MEMVVNCGKLLEWLEMDGNGWKLLGWLEMPENWINGLKLL